MRKEFAEKQDHVSCHDMEADNDESLEDMGFRPKCGGRTSSGQAHVRQEV